MLYKYSVNRKYLLIIDIYNGHNKLCDIANQPGAAWCYLHMTNVESHGYSNVSDN